MLGSSRRENKDRYMFSCRFLTVDGTSDPPKYHCGKIPSDPYYGDLANDQKTSSRISKIEVTKKR